MKYKVIERSLTNPNSQFETLNLRVEFQSTHRYKKQYEKLVKEILKKEKKYCNVTLFGYLLGMDTSNVAYVRATLYEAMYYEIQFQDFVFNFYKLENGKYVEER